MKNMKNKKWMIIGCAALIMIIIILILVLWVFPAKNGDSSSGKKKMIDDITFGLDPYASRDEAIQAIDQYGLRMDQNESRTDKSNEYRLVYYDGISLFNVEASRLLVEKRSGEKVSIAFDFADYEADMPGCHIIPNAKSSHKLLYDNVVSRFGTPRDGGSSYRSDEFFTWKKDGIEYTLSDYHGSGSKGQFYFYFILSTNPGKTERLSQPSEAPREAD